MVKKGKILKIIILFLFFLFGCSHKHVNVERELLDEGAADYWEELSSDVIRVYEGKICLNICVKAFIVASDSAKLLGLYEHHSQERVDGQIPFGMLIGLGGCLGGCYYGLHDNISWNGYDKERADRGCLISFASCVAGLSIAFWEFDDRRKSAKDISSFIKRDTVCVDKKILSKQKVKISVEKINFGKTYYTDENGNIEFRFDEFISEPNETDSTFNIIIRYHELVDSVEVRRLSKP